MTSVALCWEAESREIEIVAGKYPQDSVQHILIWCRMMDLSRIQLPLPTEEKNSSHNGLVELGPG
jgi:hypothetical protein